MVVVEKHPSNCKVGLNILIWFWLAATGNGTENVTLQDVNPGSLDQPVKEGAHQDARTISADVTEAAAVGLIGF